MSSFPWSDKRVLVTGGAGFFGSFVVDELRRRGATNVFVARSKDYNLVEREGCRRAIADAKPDLVFHLAARVGGIGANRASPGLFLYDNAMMGLQLLEECRLAGVPKTVIAGTICAYPKFAPVPFKRRRPVERLSRGDQRAVRHREEAVARAEPGVSRAVRRQFDRAVPGQHVRPAGQLRSRDVTRDSGDDPQVSSRRATRTHRRSRCGAMARRPASSSTRPMRPRAW